ncbi:MAG: dethiobiotin synthase [Muribaculaceae bacterium]|nr:dethiobiotin synthase [Muribaculaceae bacterium]
MKGAYFITGIDTDAGKSFATGWLAKTLMEDGRKVITQKFIQTGCTDTSEDIELHRAITGTGMLEEDLSHLTAPVIFTYPASAQLAAAIDGKEIDLGVIDAATSELLKRYDVVLIEGAGGMMVPITDTFMSIDYAASRKLPVILVTNSRLGSINHTVLSLEALKARQMQLHSVLYNTYFDSTDPRIAADTRGFIERYLCRNFPGTPIMDIPVINV